VSDSPRQRESNARLLNFPLEPGTRWSFESRWLFKPKGSEGVWSGEAVVVSHEKTKSPPGCSTPSKLTATGRLSHHNP
jgi:hypothetical protein